MWRVVVAAVISVVAASAAAAEGKSAEATKGASAAPKIDLQLPGLPKLDGVKGAAEEPGAPSAEGPPVLEKVEHARDFDANTGGRKPRGPVIKEFRVKSLPATTEAFKTLLRLKSPGGKPLRLELNLLAPDGTVVADTSTDVSFPYGKDTMELVVKWDGIAAKAAGTYVIEVLAGGQKLGAAPIEIVWGG